jgi:hypothetical protein
VPLPLDEPTARSIRALPGVGTTSTTASDGRTLVMTSHDEFVECLRRGRRPGRRTPSKRCAARRLRNPSHDATRALLQVGAKKSADRPLQYKTPHAIA